MAKMAGGKSPPKDMQGSEGQDPASNSARRIRDNQRRSRARHKEYVANLEGKIRDFERRGVQATMEMQQAARSVAQENARLRMLLGYHGVGNEDVDKFLQTFPESPSAEAAHIAIAQSGTSQSVISAHGNMLLQPTPRAVSTESSLPAIVAPPSARDNNTRDVVDAVVGIKRNPPRPGSEGPSGHHRSVSSEHSQMPPRPLQPQPSALPSLPSLVVGQPRPPSGEVDKLALLAHASVRRNENECIGIPPRHHDGSLRVPTPSTAGNTTPPSSITSTPGRGDSTSPILRLSDTGPSR